LADPSPESAELCAVRDRLVAQLHLQILDALGESLAAIEFNSAIEILNDRLGDNASEAIEQMSRNYFSERWLQHRAPDRHVRVD
jgi:hypothetical protein